MRNICISVKSFSHDVFLAMRTPHTHWFRSDLQKVHLDTHCIVCALSNLAVGIRFHCNVNITIMFTVRLRAVVGTLDQQIMSIHGRDEINFNNLYMRNIRFEYPLPTVLGKDFKLPMLRKKPTFVPNFNRKGLISIKKLTLY